MYVTREHCGRGIGRLLLTSLIDRLSVFPQIATIRLWVTQAQNPARALYQSVGFQVVGNAEEGIVVDDRQYDELIMELRVQLASSFLPSSGDSG
jgi:L-amino acid N-acyltransferase YncA